jgi:hypothetical protein
MGRAQLTRTNEHPLWPTLRRLSVSSEQVEIIIQVQAEGADMANFDALVRALAERFAVSHNRAAGQNVAAKLAYEIVSVFERQTPRIAASVLSRLDHISNDGGFAQRLARLEAVQAFDEDEPGPISPDQDWRLLTNFQHARGDLLHHFGLERRSSLDRHIDVRNCERLTLDHDCTLNCQIIMVASSDASVCAQIGAGAAGRCLGPRGFMNSRTYGRKMASMNAPAT